MSSPSFSRRRYYADLLADAAAATWGLLDGKSLLVGIALAIGAFVISLMLGDKPDESAVHVVVAGLALLVGVFVGHVVLAPARMHQRTVES